MGRPSSYNPNYCGLLDEHFSVGNSLESFLAKYRIPRRTFYNWIDRHSEFAFAYEMADLAALRFWERMLIAIATGTMHIVFPNHKQTAGLPKIVQTVLACRWPDIYGPNACDVGTNPRGRHKTQGRHAKNQSELLA